MIWKECDDGLTRNDILAVIASHSDIFEDCNTVIIMGAALVLLGYKTTTSDIDVVCSRRLFAELEKHNETKLSKSGSKKIVIGCIAIYQEWDVKKTITVNGIKVEALQSIVSNKLKFGREKDFLDLLAISKNNMALKKDVEYYSVFSYPYTLRGILCRGYKPIPVVFVSGFFSANKIGPNRLYYLIAEALNNMGYSVLRIDLSGMGESDGQLEDIKYSNHVFDLYNTIVSIIKDLNCKKVHLIGHCEGCLTVLDVLKYSNLIDSITLLAPFWPERESFNKLLGEGIYDSIKNTHSPIYRKGIFCDWSFIEASKGIVDMSNVLLAKKHNCLFIIPKKDEFINVNNLCNYLNKHKLQYILVDDADHNFLMPNARNNLLRVLANRFNNLEERL